MAPESLSPLTIDTPRNVKYAVDLWVRDLQIKTNLAKTPRRLERTYPLRDEPIAVVGFGPSLNDTWEDIKCFTSIITCSGAHKFLLDRAVIPTWHLEVDPRKHKIALVGDPHSRVQYLVASACHPSYVDHLLKAGVDVRIWHVFDPTDEGIRNLPPNEWAVCGGCSAGLRAMTMARFLGFRDLHVFGMDGNSRDSGKHAAAHPNQAKEFVPFDYDGKTYYTSPAFLEAAIGTFHELDAMPDVQATFHGDGLVQAMALKHQRPKQVTHAEIGFFKEPLITPEYANLNAQLHTSNLAYGVGGGKHAKTVEKLVASLLKDTPTMNVSVLDYGCGKSQMAKALAFPIWEYDPAIPGKQESPRPADLVVCSDVLEHIEPDKLTFVLTDLARCVKRIGYFIIHTGPATKTLADGRNTHLIQQPKAWWKETLAHFFTVAKVWDAGAEVQVLVAPHKTPIKVRLRPASSGIGIAFSRLIMRKEPYAIGAAADVFDSDLYTRLAETFPDVSLFRTFTGDKKCSLSERHNSDAYQAFIAKSDLWRAFHGFVKSEAFKAKVLRVLRAHRVHVDGEADTLTSRFEFSMLPADGGFLRPHTDLASKVVTLVIGMPTPGDAWDPAWGGGTGVLKLKDETRRPDDYSVGLDAFDVVQTYPYQANQCVVFVKTENSWHSVGPLTGPSGQFRRTITVNIEKVA